uniref:Uncharacterized protein n=1 Tax=Anguilla anguilla TaxID=7936 RepID=A0A0E9U5Q0_ANGAN
MCLLTLTCTLMIFFFVQLCVFFSFYLSPLCPLYPSHFLN